jgi:hypothetical protein
MLPHNNNDKTPLRLPANNKLVKNMHELSGGGIGSMSASGTRLAHNGNVVA